MEAIAILGAVLVIYLLTAAQQKVAANANEEIVAEGIRKSKGRDVLLSDEDEERILAKLREMTKEEASDYLAKSPLLARSLEDKMMARKRGDRLAEMIVRK